MNFIYPVLGSVAKAAEASGEGGFNIYTYVISLINVLFLFYLLRLILFKPVTNILNQRTEKIRKEVEDAKVNNEKASEIKAQYEEQLKGIKQEGDQIIKSSEDKARVQADQIIKKALDESNRIMKRAEEQAEVEVQNALKDAKTHITSLALQAATKVVEANMDNEKNKQLVDQFIDEVGAIQ